MNLKVGQEAILLGSIAQAMPDPIFILDEEGTYVEVIGGIERDLYDSGVFLKRKTLHDVFPVEIADLFLSTVKKAIDTGKLQVIEYELTSVDMKFNPMDGPESPQWFEGRVYPFNFQGGERTVVLWMAINITEKKKAQHEREKAIKELQQALIEIKTLRGLLPICIYCKQVRDDEGFWRRVDEYVQKHTEVRFSHGICPDCMKKHFPEFLDEVSEVPPVDDG